MDNTLPPPEAEARPAESPEPVEKLKNDASAYADPQAVLVIPRVLVNYIIIAVVFFGLGAIITYFATSSLNASNRVENQALIAQAVKEALDARGQVAEQPPGLQPGQQYEVSADDDPAKGPADAPITIVEFSDFRCPYCGRFFSQTLQPLLDNYGDQVRMVFRDYPILGASSVLSALAGECMNEQGKFWEFHNLAFSNQQNLTREAFIGYAQTLAMNVEQFTQCLDSQQYIQEISADASYAQNLGVTGTPAFFVNGRFISGAQPYNVFASIIDEELSKLKDSTPEAAPSS